MGKDDTNYFLRRANEELEAAEHAVNVRAAQAHKELASLY